MLLEECRAAGVQIHLQTGLEGVTKRDDNTFVVSTSSGEITAESLVVASGGLSVPKMGATGLGYQIAKQFGVTIVPPQPALVPFTLNEQQLQNMARSCRCFGGGESSKRQTGVSRTTSVHASRPERTGHSANLFVLAAR